MAMDVIMPQLGETVSEGTVSVWHRQVGDTVSKREPLFDVSSDKVEMEVPAPADGTLLEIRVDPGMTVPVGAVVAIISSETGTISVEEPIGRSPDPVKSAAVPTSEQKNAKTDQKGKLHSPVVRRLIREHGIDPSALSGTGADGRIKKQDVLDYLASKKPVRSTEKASEIVPESEKIPFNKLRKLTAEHMVRSKSMSAHVLQAVEADFSRVAVVRDRVGSSWKKREGFSLTWLPFIARAVCIAIRDFPRVNAEVEGDALLVHRRINLGVAIDLDFDGLVAPVIKDADRLSVPELARQIRTLSSKAKERSLTPDDFTEGTYTISNSGVFGTLITAPIINQPQVAILSTDGISKKAVVVETESEDFIAIRPVGVLAQSFDHRAIDGAYSAAFLDRVRGVIQTTNWVSMFEQN